MSDPTADKYECLIRALGGESFDSIIGDFEKRGQDDLVRSAKLPRKCERCTRQQLEQMGIVFGEDIDDLFVAVVLPDGWKLQPTDHSMWSDLLDEKGRCRALVFFKAAFYDREAFISLECRYSCRQQPVCGWDSPDYKCDVTPFVAIVTDVGKEIWRSKEVPKYGDDRLYKWPRKWLNRHFPKWEDPLAYWDETA